MMRTMVMLLIGTAAAFPGNTEHRIAALEREISVSG